MTGRRTTSASSLREAAPFWLSLAPATHGPMPAGPARAGTPFEVAEATLGPAAKHVFPAGVIEIVVEVSAGGLARIDADFEAYRLPHSYEILGTHPGPRSAA